VKIPGIVICSASGAIGATAGYFLPCKVSTGFVIGAMAVALGAADLVIKESLKLVDDRVKAELDDVKTAYRVVPGLGKARQGLLRLTLVAMICKGIALAAGGLATQGKSSPLVLAIGCGALAFGAVLTAVIWISHESLQKQASADAIERAEAKAAKNSVERLGSISGPSGAPERPIIDIGAKATVAKRDKRKR